MMLQKDIGADFLTVVQCVPDIRKHLLRIYYATRNKLFRDLIFFDAENNRTTEGVGKWRVGFPNTIRDSSFSGFNFNVHAFVRLQYRNDVNHLFPLRMAYLDVSSGINQVFATFCTPAILPSLHRTPIRRDDRPHFLPASVVVINFIFPNIPFGRYYIYYIRYAE